MSDGTEEPESSFAALGRTALEMLRTRAELLSVEFAQELVQFKGLAIWAALAALAIGLGVQLAALLVVAWLWDTPYRMQAVIGTALVFASVGAACAGAFIVKLRSKPPLFDSSLRALKADIDALRSRR